MAIVIEKNSGTTAVSDGATYDPDETGSNQGIATFTVYKYGSGSATSSDFQLDSENYVQDIGIIETSLISFYFYITAGTIKEADIPATAGALTHDAVLSSAADAEGGVIFTLSGMLQSGSIIKDLQLQTYTASLMPSLTFNQDEGDLLLIMYESSSGTLSAPTTNSNGDSYNEEATGVITESPMSQGKVYSCITTTDLTSESEGGWLTPTTGGGWVGLVVIGSADVAGGSIIPQIMHHRRMMQ